MHRSRAYISLLICLVFLFFAVPVAPGASRSEIDASRQRAQDAREAAKQAEEKAEQFRAEARQLDEAISDLNAQIRELDPEITEAASSASRLRAEVESLKMDIAATEAEIEATEAEYEYQQKLLNDRMTASYKQGNSFYLDLVLNAKSITDLIARTTLVQRVISANNDVALTLIYTQEQLESARSDLDRKLTAVAAKRAEADAVEKNLRSLRSQRQSALNHQQAAQREKTSLMEASEDDAERWKAQAEEEEAAARRMEAELRASASTGSGEYTGGVMAWPVPGGTLTSPYGWRIHPIFGSKRFHHGIDITRGSGTIVAAADGEVIRASYGWNGGYGNLVVLDHGEGVTTLYAHILDGGINVSSGQQVSKGQPIALVGSTGYSTGPHLHFEVRINGASTDPMAYLR